MCQTRFPLAMIKKTVFPNSYGYYRLIYKVSNLVSVQYSNPIRVFMYCIFAIVSVQIVVVEIKSR